MLYITKDAFIVQAMKWDGTSNGALKIEKEMNVTLQAHISDGSLCNINRCEDEEVYVWIEYPNSWGFQIDPGEYLIKNPLKDTFFVMDSQTFEKEIACQLPGNEKLTESYYDLWLEFDQKQKKLDAIILEMELAKDQNPIREIAKKKALELIGQVRIIFDKLCADENKEKEEEKYA